MWKLKSVFYILRKNTQETHHAYANAFCKSVFLQHILGPKWEACPAVLPAWQLFEYSRCET